MLTYLFVIFLVCMAFCFAINIVVSYIDDKREKRYDKVARPLAQWCRTELAEGHYATARRIFKVYCRHYLKYRPSATRNEMEDSIGYR